MSAISRQFLEIPGLSIYELPPLLMHASTHIKRLNKTLEMAGTIVESEDLESAARAKVTDATFAFAGTTSNKMHLALDLVEEYMKLLHKWRCGRDILHWISQCEITFENLADLRQALRTQLWPHSARSSFVTLLGDKSAKNTRRGFRTGRGFGSDFCKTAGNFLFHTAVFGPIKLRNCFHSLPDMGRTKHYAAA